MKAHASATVVAVAGRRIDADGARTEKFPLRNRERVRAEITTRFTAAQVVAIVSSAACGADLIALEAAGSLGVRRRIVLPFDVATFRARSVADRPGEWGPIYDAIVSDVAAAGDLLVLGVSPSNRDAYEQTNRAILVEGSTLAVGTRARMLAIVVWEGASRVTRDHTQDFHTRAVAGGWTVEEIITR